MKRYLYNFSNESSDALSSIKFLQAMNHMKISTLRCQLFAIKTRPVDVPNRTILISIETNMFVFDMQSIN